MTHLTLLALLAAAKAVAHPPPADAGGAFILRIEGRDAYFDLGRAAGAQPGDRVRVYRVVTALNPATQRPVQDRFAVTEIEIAEAGEVLSRARPDPDVARLLHVGDRVELVQRPALVAEETPREPSEQVQGAQVQGAHAEPAPQEARGRVVQVPGAQPRVAALPEQSSASTAEAPARTAERDEALQFRDAFLHAQALPPAERARHWESWSRAHAGTQLALAVGKEIEVLRPREPAAPEPARPSEPLPALSAPSWTIAGEAIEMVLTLPPQGKRPRAAVLNYRPHGTGLFKPVLFEAADAGYLRAQVPQDAVVPPGIDYTVGIVDTAGAETPLEPPKTIEVDRAPGTDLEIRKERSRAGLWIDAADWNRFKGNDYHYNLEGEFLYRTLSTLHSVRMGFGLYQGVGESLSDMIADERMKQPYRSHRVGYHYGFTELEFHPTEMLGFIVKGLTGVDRGGFKVGVEGRIRIGQEAGTSLLLSSGFTPGIGNKNEITLSWDRVQGFPMAGSVIVTNEPVQADYGVRFLYTVGRRLADFVDVSVRLSYQLRDINHNGFGVGVAESFHW